MNLRPSYKLDKLTTRELLAKTSKLKNKSEKFHWNKQIISQISLNGYYEY